MYFRSISSLKEIKLMMEASTQNEKFCNFFLNINSNFPLESTDNLTVDLLAEIKTSNRGPLGIMKAK